MLYRIIKLFLLLFSLDSFSDSMKFNSFNNNGVMGLINTPTARMPDTYTVSLTTFKSENTTKSGITFNAFNMIEMSFTQTSYEDDLNNNIEVNGFNWSNIKLRVKEEGRFPAIVMGLNNVGGPAFSSSEYIVASYGLASFDFSLGFGWGALDRNNDFSNRLIDIDDNFRKRGQSNNILIDTDSDHFFSGETASIFGGINYAINNNFLLKLEYDSHEDFFNTNENLTNLTYGFEFIGYRNFNFGLYSIKGEKISVRASYVFNL